MKVHLVLREWQGEANKVRLLLCHYEYLFFSQRGVGPFPIWAAPSGANHMANWTCGCSVCVCERMMNEQQRKKILVWAETRKLEGGNNRCSAPSRGEHYTHLEPEQGAAMKLLTGPRAWNHAATAWNSLSLWALHHAGSIGHW